MGTNGYVYVRCRGRYFVYYNHFDSYPKGLGEAILALIPTDPEKYREWLQSMRKTYNALCQQFEEYHLPVEVTADDVELSPAEQHAKCFLALDDRLGSPPLQTLLYGNHLFIEWTYTVDLDRELFVVDSAASFILSKIPRGERWIEYIGADARGRTNLSKATPKGIIGSAVWQPQVDHQAKVRYGDFSVDVVFPKTAIEVAGLPRNCYQHLLLITFHTAHCHYLKLLDEHVLTWKPDDFSFRELAFGLLSFAAGEVVFECPDTLNRNYGDEGYFLVPDERIHDNQQKLLPKFLGESHLPGKQPGSAPMGTTFWLGNTLVHLASRLDLVDVEESSVAKVVDTGLGQGLKSFHALVFSILDFVLMQVRVNETGGIHVQRSPLMSLFYFTDENSAVADGPRSRTVFCQGAAAASDSKDRSDSDMVEGSESDETESDQEPRERLTEKDHTGFIALMHFFDAAAYQHLRGSRSKVLPNEILTNIMEFSDHHTSLALAKASACCREVRSRRFPLSKYYVIVDVGPGGRDLTLEARDTGEKAYSTVNHVPRDSEKECMKVNPVIGVADACRHSIMEAVTLCFPGVSPKDSLYTKEACRPSPEQYHTVYGYYHDDESSMVFNIPDHAYPGFIEKAWGRYIARLLKTDEICYFCHLKSSSFRCLLPIRYRELQQDYPGSEFVAIVRSANDESPEEWKETERYGVRKFSRREEKESPRSQTRGCLVIMAFGTKVKLFYYIYYREEPYSGSPSPNNSYSSRIAACITDPDPAHRLVQITPGQEPLDICDESARELLEFWIKAFNANWRKRVEYDPITETYVPCPEEHWKGGQEDEGAEIDE